MSLRLAQTDPSVCPSPTPDIAGQHSITPPDSRDGRSKVSRTTFGFLTKRWRNLSQLPHDHLSIEFTQLQIHHSLSIDSPIPGPSLVQYCLRAFIPTCDFIRSSIVPAKPTKMGQTDLEVLLDMGFEKARAELAVKKTGGRQFYARPKTQPCQ